MGQSMKFHKFAFFHVQTQTNVYFSSNGVQGKVLGVKPVSLRF